MTVTPARVTPRHAWFPVSGCSQECLRPRVSYRLAAAVETALVAGRLGKLCAVGIWVALPAPIVSSAAMITGRQGTDRRGWRARALLWAMGIGVLVDDRRPATDTGPGLVVANHISFLDVLALALVSPAHVVAKADVLALPLAARLAHRFGVIPVDRNTLRRLPETVGEVARRLSESIPVIVFPEGTTFCGRSSGRFRPAFFQAAIDSGSTVYPVRLEFTGHDGKTDTAPSFIGADTPGHTLWRVLRTRGLTLRVVLLPAQRSRTDRRELAARCERIIASSGASAESDITRVLI